MYVVIYNIKIALGLFKCSETKKTDETQTDETHYLQLSSSGADLDLTVKSLDIFL